MRDRVGAYLQYLVCKAIGIETAEKLYTHTHTRTHAKPVCEREDETELRNQEVHTDREVTTNRPNVIIINKKRKHAS
jgi:hypothetical protein